MSTLTIRIEASEKASLAAWAAERGLTVTDYVKSLVAADMAKGSPESRAAAWFRENVEALSQEAQYIEDHGVPGAEIALNHPGA